MVRLRFQGKMMAAFGLVLAVFVTASVVTLMLSGASQSKWYHTTRWQKAMSAATEQIDGTHTQLAAQALYVATGDERYKREWEQGVKKVESSTATVAALGLAEVTRIAKGAEEADAKHDAAVTKELFPAMAAGDQAAALRALRKADRYVRIPLAAQDRIAGVVARARADDVASASASARQARLVAILAALFGVAAAGAVAFVFSRRVASRLKAVTAAASGLAEGATSRSTPAAATRSPTWRAHSTA